MASISCTPAGNTFFLWSDLIHPMDISAFVTSALFGGWSGGSLMSMGSPSVFGCIAARLTKAGLKSSSSASVSVGLGHSAVCGTSEVGAGEVAADRSGVGLSTAILLSDFGPGKSGTSGR